VNFKSILFACLVQLLVTTAWAGEEAGNIEAGKDIFHADLGCHVCHGEDASGSIGPNIRETITLEKVYYALQNFQDMISWQYNYPELFEDQAIKDVVAYLQSLPREP